MNKIQLKKAFEKEFEKITVSDQLKSKTVNAINTSHKRTSHIPYIRNFAAVFVVTLLCVSIYFTNNFSKKQFYSDNVITNETQILESTINEKQLERKMENSTSLKSIKPETIYNNKISKSTPSPSFYSLNDFGNIATDDLQLQMEKYSTDCAVPESTDTLLSEAEFLKQYPDAEKIENGYIIYENEKQTTYIFKDGMLENIVTIES